MTTKELEIKIAYLDTLLRGPTPTELSSWPLTATIEAIVEELQTTAEYLALQGEYAGSLEYPSAHVVSLSDIQEANYRGLQLSNGRVTIVTSARTGRETVEYMGKSTFRPFETSGQDSPDIRQTIDMLNGVFTTMYLRSDGIEVTRLLCPLLNFPDCICQQWTFVSPSDISVDLSHITCHDFGKVSWRTTFTGKDVYLHGVSSEGASVSHGYIFEDDFRNLGNNSDCNTGYNVFGVDLVAGVPFKVTVMSSFAGLSQAMLMVRRGVEDVLADHSHLWRDRWSFDIFVVPKNSPIARRETLFVNRTIRMALFQAYNNPYGEDPVWLTPFYLFVSPEVSREYLDRSIASLKDARALAASEGYPGSLFSDSRSSLDIHTTAWLSICAWNYYRVTRDLGWLRYEGGHELLQQNARYIEAKLIRDRLSEYPFTEEIVDSDELVSHLADLAIWSAIQSSYVLNECSPFDVPEFDASFNDVSGSSVEAALVRSLFGCYDASSVELVSDELLQALDVPWGSLGSSLSALFLLVVMVGPGGLRIVGEVDCNNNVLETLGVKTRISNTMPTTWKSLSLGHHGVFTNALVEHIVFPGPVEYVEPGNPCSPMVPFSGPPREVVASLDCSLYSHGYVDGLSDLIDTDCTVSFWYKTPIGVLSPVFSPIVLPGVTLRARKVRLSGQRVQVDVQGALRNIDGVPLDIDPGKWTHFALSYSNTLRSVVVYVNGLHYGQCSTAREDLLRTPAIERTEVSFAPFDGELADYVIFDEVLSPYDVRMLYSNPANRHPRYDSVVAHWDFEFVGETTFPDISESGRDLRFVKR